MGAGDFKHRVQVLEREKSRDSFGGVVEEWTKVVATLWAKVEELSGREMEVVTQAVGETTHRFTFRNTDKVSKANRLKWKGREFDVNHVGTRPEDRNRWTIATGKELV